MALAVAWALVAAVAAGATTVTVGSVMPPNFTSEPFGGVHTEFNTTLGEPGALIGSPVNGAIIRWKVQGAKGGPFTLRVLRPNGSGGYTAVGASHPATPLGTGLETFSTQLTVHAGDMIGVDSSNAGDEIGVASAATSAFGVFPSTPFENSTNAPAQIRPGEEIELSAEVQPAPTITALSAAAGSVLGGETVTITGANLNGATAVMFGTVPATSFTVEGEEKITAVVPAQLKVGSVAVTAKTLAGESPTNTASSFAYGACTVPKLVGRNLKSAKSAIRAGGCTVGKVTKVKGPQRKRGKVNKQNPTAGGLIAPGAPVAIQLVK